MHCEICGNETNAPKVIMSEGSRITVCPGCTSHGTFVGNYSTSGPTKIYKRSRYKRMADFEIVPDFDKRIRDARAKRGWNQKELADKVNESASVVAHLESGKMTPTRKVATKFEKILGIKLFDNSGGDEQVEFVQPSSKEITLGDIVKIKKR